MRLRPTRRDLIRKRLPNQQDEVNFDATLTFSASEKLQRMDFEQMNAAEWEAARKAAASLALPMRPLRTGRSAPARQGRIDLRACLQQSRKTGGEIIGIERT